MQYIPKRLLTWPVTWVLFYRFGLGFPWRCGTFFSAHLIAGRLLYVTLSSHPTYPLALLLVVTLAAAAAALLCLPPYLCPPCLWRSALVLLQPPPPRLLLLRLLRLLMLRMTSCSAVHILRLALPALSFIFHLGPTDFNATCVRRHQPGGGEPGVYPSETLIGVFGFVCALFTIL